MKAIFEVEEFIRYLGREFRRKRNAQGKTLEQVGFDLDVSPSYIGKIERAELINLSLYMYMRLARYYNIQIDTITHKARLAHEKDLKEGISFKDSKSE